MKRNYLIALFVIAATSFAVTAYTTTPPGGPDDGVCPVHAQEEEITLPDDAPVIP